jgi:hypothetical protein
MQVIRTLRWSLAPVWLIIACSDSQRDPSGPRLNQPSLRATIGGFGCGVTYDAITQTNETELAAYGVEAVTDTARICEQWTGNDYNGEITLAGSSEPASDYAEDVGTVIYQNGATTVYDRAGNQMDGPAGVGANSFDFVAATPDEQQASYNEPYYAVVQDPDPVHCSNPPCAQQNVQVGGRSNDVTIPANPIRRSVLKALLRNKTEIAPSLEGFRQFRSVTPAGEETVLSIDPITELIRRQEVNSAKSRVRADMKWSLINGKFVREEMNVTGTEVINGREISSLTRVQIRNLAWNPDALK